MARIKKPVKRSSSGSPPFLDIDVPSGVSLRLTPELSKKLEAYCSKTGASKNSAISIAIADFLADR
jgi:hypothetical protein